MTNREWINSLSNEELARFMDKKICCNICVLGSYDECGKNCEKNIAEWLNKKHIEPMPEIRGGDIFIYKQSQVPFLGVCVYGDIVYLPDIEKCFTFSGIIKENTISIKRYDITKGTLEEIWRADNE